MRCVSSGSLSVSGLFGRMSSVLRLMLFVLSVLLTAAVVPDPALFESLRATDLQLATLGDRLARANVALCDTHQPSTGLVLMTVDAIEPAARDGARAAFGFVSPIIVEAVMRGSPAEAAALHPNDGLVSVNGEPAAPGAVTAKASLARALAIDRRLGDLPPAAPMLLTLDRAGQRIERTLKPLAACRGRFELIVSHGWESSTSSDGSTVRISSRFLAELSDEELAVVVAHEFAHVILHHEQRLTGAGVTGGLLGGFGRNVRYIRQAETQADILSVDLLANAGFPADAATRFWQGKGRQLSGGIFADRSHPAAADRAATTNREAKAIAADPERAKHPPILADRDRPLDGNWQAILVHAP
jgi:Zn-dependent protease with chaperone function